MLKIPNPIPSNPKMLNCIPNSVMNIYLPPSFNLENNGPTMIPARIIQDIMRNKIDKSKMKYAEISTPKNIKLDDCINAVTD